MAEVKIGKIVLGMCQTNTYFLYREGSSECIVVDPADKGEMLFDTLAEKGFTVKNIILTHGHFDHIWGVEGLLSKDEDIKVYASEDEKELLDSPELNCSASCGRPCTVSADVYLKDNEEISLCGITLKAIKTPGHTQGGMNFYIEEALFLLSGDTLFCESVGRTDLPTGSMSTLIRSINEKLMVLPEKTKVYPGHGSTTTISYEKDYNPFL